MHTAVFYGLSTWFVVLVAVLAAYAAISRNTTVRTLALDTLALAVVGALAVLAVYRDQAGFLDVALVIAMLGFVETVAVARLVERRRELR